MPEAIAAEARTWGQVAEKAGADGGQGYSKGFEKEISKNIPKAVEKAHQGSKSSAEKAGKDAGDAYAGRFASSVKSAVDKLNRSVPTIKPDVDDKTAKAKIRSIMRDLAVLGDSKAEIGVDLNAGTTMALLAKIEQNLRDLNDTSPSIDVRVNAADALLEVERVRMDLMRLSAMQVEPEIKIKQQGAFERTIQDAIRSALNNIPPVDLKVDSSAAEREIASIRADLISLGDKQIGVDITAEQAFLEVGRLQARLEQLSHEGWNVQIDVDSLAAASQLETVLKMVEKLDGDTAHVQVDVDAAAALVELDAVEKKMHHLSAGGESGANAFRAFNARTLGFTALGPAALPAITGLAGAAGAAGPLGAIGLAGLGVGALGLSGVSNATKQLLNVQKNSGQDVRAHEKAVRNAGDTVQSAQQNLANARQSAAQQQVSSGRAIEAADRGVASAERALQDAQKAALTAQQDLTRAREDAVKAERDLQFQVEGGAIAYQQSLLDVKDAEAALAQVRKDPKSTPEQIQRATLNLQEQQLRVKELAAQNGDLAEKQAQWVKGGVEGSDQVVAAQAKVQAANRNVADQQQALTLAQQAASQARADAAVQAAQSQQAIANSQRELVKAQENYDTTLQATTASQRNLNDAMKQLGPSSQAFAHFFVDTVIPAFYELRKVAADGFLPGLQSWFNVLVGTYGPQIIRIVGGMSTALGGMFDLFGRTLESPPFHAFFNMIERDGPVFIGMMGQILANLGTAIVSLVTALEPLGFLFGQWLIDATAAFARWAQNLPNTTGFQTFLADVRKDGPLVAKLLMALAGAAGNLIQALLPYAEALVGLLTKILDWIAGMDPKTLGAVAAGILGVIVAFQVLVGLTAAITGLSTVVNILTDSFYLLTAGMAAVESVGAAVAGIVLVVIAALVAIGIGLYLAYTHFQWFHDAVDAVWQGIQAAAKAVADWFMQYVWPVFVAVWNGIVAAAQWAWTQVLEPIFTLMGHIFMGVFGLLQEAWLKIGFPIFQLIGEIVGWLWNNVIAPIFGFIGAIFMAVWHQLSVMWTEIGKPVFDAIIAVVTWLWDHIFQPVFSAILTAFGWLVQGIKWAWENVLGPVFTVIMDIAKVLGMILVVVVFGAIRLAWEAMVMAMTAVWNYLLKPLWEVISEAATGFWNDVLKPIFGAIGAGWQQLMEGLSWVYHHVIEPVWDAFKKALGAVADYFGITKDTIQTVWDGIKAVIATPINFVIGVIFNKGLFAAWNWIIDNLGLPKSWHAGPWKQIEGPGIPQFAAGGKVPGQFVGPRADNVLAQVNGGGMIRVNPREWIHPVDAVDYYGPEFMEALQKRQIPKELLGLAGGGQIPGYAGGGQVASTWGSLWGVIKNHFPDAILTSGYRPGDPGYHGMGDAIDVSFPGNPQNRLEPLAAWIASQYPGSTELIHNPNASIKNGKNVPPSFWGAATWNEHANHVHWAETAAAWMGGAGAPGGGSASPDGGGGFIGWLGRVWHGATDALDSLKDSVKDVAQLATRFGDSPIVQGIAQAPGNLVDKMWTAASSFVEKFFASTFSDDSNTPADAAGLRDQAYAVANLMYGWNSAADKSAIDYIVGHESGWRANAQNPVSTASGLWQMIDGTWRSYRPIEAAGYAHMKDAPAGMQDKAGMRYVHDRYKTLSGAQAYWQSHHNYAEGGQVPADGIVPELMDWGGWIQPGLNVIMNKTHRPEPVVNPQTLDNLTTIAENGGAGGSAIGTLIQNLQQVSSARQVAGEVDHAATVARRGGKY